VTRTPINRHALTEIRERAGYNKSQLARAAGISPGYVADIESGRRPSVGPSVFLRLVEVLDVEPEALLVAPAGPPGLPAPPPVPPRRPGRWDPLVGTPTEVAVRLGVSVGTTHEMIRAGMIPSCPLGRGRKRAVPWAALEEWLRCEAASSLAPYCPECPCPRCATARRARRPSAAAS
jgi:DNA binding domain, excisionase family